MKSILFVNGINIGLLIGFIVLYIVLGFPIWFLFIFGIWLVYMIICNMYLLRSDDIKKKLMQADSRHEFKGYVKAICNAIDSVEFFRHVFSEYPPDNPIHETFDFLDKKAYQNAERAYRWIKTYNYIIKPSQEYIIRLAENSYQITQKLSDLNELMIKVEDSTSNVDISYVDDLLMSLKELLGDADN